MMRTTLLLLLLLLLALLLPASPADGKRHKPNHKPRIQREATAQTPYLVRIYDYSTIYRPYVEYAARYYQRILSPYGVEVRYLPMPSLPIDQCNAVTTPQTGIRVCENLDPDRTASSTGMEWVPDPRRHNRWALRSFNLYQMPDPQGDGGMWGRYMTCHELGHSFGLGHAFDPANTSCMSALGGWDPDTLTPGEIEQIVGFLPALTKGKR